LIFWTDDISFGSKFEAQVGQQLTTRSFVAVAGIHTYIKPQATSKVLLDNKNHASEDAKKASLEKVLKTIDDLHGQGACR
jgi:hypothetical protein